ncbi:MAG TPA: TPM domain-containing protein [Thermoanaerobaculia bacterium]|nr:TPM domain-containing protein [Thermoanaerobaculia bacterium]
MTRIPRSSIFVCLVFVLALLAGAFPILAVAVEEIPSPRPEGWSVDFTGSVPPETRQEIDRLGDRIHAASGAELIVVVIDSTGDVPSRDFAIDLFNHWGLDESAGGKGLLLFAALGDRSAEIVLGRDLDTPANNQASEAIMQGEMVPRFRAGDPGGALLEGARASSRHILALDVAPLPAETATPMPPRAAVPAQPRPVARTRERPDPDRFSGMVLAILAGLGLGGAGFFLMRDPRCKQCRIPMNLLEEQQDDAHLTPAERTEERIGSIDHQIWTCPQCGEMRRRAWSKIFSGFSRCSSCQAKAVRSTSWVIERPTYSSSGTGRVDTLCAHCGHQTSYTTVIPRLERPRPATSSRSSSGSSSSSRSSSFRSSGGGRSSRGGASGKW